MTKRTVPCWVIACLLVGSIERASADPTPLDATVAVVAQARVSDSPAQYQRFTQSADANLDPLYLSAFAESNPDAGYAAAYTSVYAAWDSPSAGFIQFGETGFTTDATGASGIVTVQDTRWTYRFQAAEDGAFTLDYEADLTDDTTAPTGLQGVWFVVILGGYEPVFEQVFAPGDAGTVTVPLNTNQTYAVSLFPLAQLTDDLGTRVAGFVGNFDFAISEGQ